MLKYFIYWFNMQDSITRPPTKDQPMQKKIKDELTMRPRCERDDLIDSFSAVRLQSTALCRTLENEDFGLQAMPEVSPPKWHLAHTTWFFEIFILIPFDSDYRPYHEHYEYLFNSYYNGVGTPYPRSNRGLLSRPTVEEVLAYRDHVNNAMVMRLQQYNHPNREEIDRRCVLGLHHEQQHQELFCTDIKYSFSMNPLYPSLRPTNSWNWKITGSPAELNFVTFEAADTSIGHRGDGFHFDNETPPHNWAQPAFRFANRLVTNAEFKNFVDDGGYDKAMLWLSDGWAWNQSHKAKHPRYWHQLDDEWQEYTLYGVKKLDPNLPVAHVNYYEADAFARWYGKRLPTEQEWEFVCDHERLRPTHDDVLLHPIHQDTDTNISQMFGHLWQWTQSSYSPYPGYRPASGAIGEYNGKFMCNQMVLRGSSCVTPIGHARSTYRNFFYPKDQWQFTGIRLADDLL